MDSAEIYEECVEGELNNLTLDCHFQPEMQLVAGEIIGLYGIGIGPNSGEEDTGIFIDREQAAELLESLLEFIEGGE